MKRIHIVGIAFAAIFAFSMVGASGASALSLWDECIKTATTLAFQDADCSVAGPPNVWGWEEIKVPTEVDSLVSTLTLLSNGVTIDCEGSMDGTVGGGAKDEVVLILNNVGAEVTEANPVKCPVLAGNLACGNEANASPLHLPWKTELLAAGGDLLEGSGVGHPGWLVVCLGGLKATNECAREDTILTVENLLSELEVDLGFKPLEKADCSVGGVGAGEVEGTVSILLVNGNALRAM
ncbi:MAG TPA: hypothetical protein VNX67_10070 [Solirubrobacteraceae bacterium]|jgi:hypothetical protein|nr:hypothetical protein [Solirubrobacteraceae bacterium]